MEILLRNVKRIFIKRKMAYELNKKNLISGEKSGYYHQYLLCDYCKLVRICRSLYFNCRKPIMLIKNYKAKVQGVLLFRLSVSILIT